MSQQETQNMAKHFYRASAADFMKIPGSPVAYWISAETKRAFSDNPSLNSVGKACAGHQTGDNDLLLKQWFEVSFADIGFDIESRDQAKNSGYKWFPHRKGGSFRRWYGNYDYVINWLNDGDAVRRHPSSALRNPDFMFKPGVTWSHTSSGSFSARLSQTGDTFNVEGPTFFSEDTELSLGYFCSNVALHFMQIMNPTLHFLVGSVSQLPFKSIDRVLLDGIRTDVRELVEIGKYDWDSSEISFDFRKPHLLDGDFFSSELRASYSAISSRWLEITTRMQSLEKDNNRLFIEAYGLNGELSPDAPLHQVTLNCNPYYRYGANRSDEELETLLQCDTLRELVSYAIGCMMGRYSLDKQGLILASQGETLQDYLNQVPDPRFAPDDDAILPLTDQEWFPDDATNRFCEFLRVVWGGKPLQKNLDFVAESLCLHAIKPKRGESALDTIRRYLSTQFFKDHLRTYKKRPIYWLFSSGKHKAFECLVYLQRYNDGTLARMRTEYVIPLSAKLNAYAEKLEQDKDASASAAETKRLEKEIATLHKQQTELADFDEKLRHYADQRISLDLDDGVKVNYGKFGDLLAEVKAVTGQK
ncbi:BREX-1 system adenine-specific DNA-methyltransferase PglX [Marinobacter salexigens]|uniref:BREX-1 system adenine-specific DNA-methyltransferase PglX n=1 Tax=Marinobacter salexigens TaxID=1925763 RepID=A0ABS6A8E8_9GAMM|nr:BREX-1 system adenine-specific DNA-methyltransferase PglX [Marinobacter salexigens]MBU2874291.1 BREX-1 system adenine-specific DNA-methyltransferase PglX [Marinobacter salexigens]